MLTKKEEAERCLELSGRYLAEGDYPKALEYANKRIALLEEIGDIKACEQAQSELMFLQVADAQKLKVCEDQAAKADARGGKKKGKEKKSFFSRFRKQ